jgi:hypothetical protein
MAESIIIHFRDADHSSIEGALGDCACATTTGWRYPDEDRYTVTMYAYDDLAQECGPEDVARIQRALGGLPTYSLVIELARSRGNQAVDDAACVARKLLGRFDGVVDDTYSELWTPAELEARTEKRGQAFLDCYRH